jgi:glucans biosynthesis protein
MRPAVPGDNAPSPFALNIMKPTTTRRKFLRTAITLSLAAPLLGATRSALAQQKTLNLAPPEKFSFEHLVERARSMAQREFVPLPRPAPDVVQRLTYDEWGKIRFDTRYALFADGPGMYPVTFFHLGEFFQKGIRMHVLSDGQSRQILYNSAYFEMPKVSPASKLPEQAGCAGFRLLQ